MSARATHGPRPVRIHLLHRHLLDFGEQFFVFSPRSSGDTFFLDGAVVIYGGDQYDEIMA